MEQIAAAIRSGRIPMHLNHDITKPIPTRNIEAGVETLPDGHLAAWAEFDTDDDRWAEFEAQRDAAGALGGMSISFAEDIPRPPRREEPRVVVAADPGHFDDGTILRAAAALDTLGASKAERLYQFAHAPEAKVVIDFLFGALTGVGINLISSVIYDAAKSFLRHGRATVFNINAQVGPTGRRKIKMHMVTDDPAALEHFTNCAAELLCSTSDGTFAYDQSSESLRRIGPAESDSEDGDYADGVG